MPIPPYNTKPVRELYHEYAYHHSEGRICRKGGKYYVPFKVNIIPENLVVENGKYTYHHEAMKRAMAWMENNQYHLFIEWWGPDNDNVEEIENILVRFRDYQPISWNEEAAYLAHIRKNLSPAQQKFAGQQFGQIGRFIMTEEYIPQTAWQRFLYRIGKVFTIKRPSYIYEDVDNNWELYQEEIIKEITNDDEEPLRLK